MIDIYLNFLKYYPLVIKSQKNRYLKFYTSRVAT